MDSKSRVRAGERSNRPQRLDYYLERLRRSAGLTESQVITLIHRFGSDRSALRRAAEKLAPARS